MSTHTTEVTIENFEEKVLASDKPVLVDFWAEWCQPCHRLAPIVDKLAQENAERLRVVKVDVDLNQELAGRYQITSIPTMMVFKDGEIVKELVGAMPKSMIEEELESVI